MKNKIIISLIFVIGSSVLQGCGGLSSNNGNSYPSQAESEVCNTNTNHTSYVTVSGNARFYKRTLVPTVVSGQVTRFALSSSTSTNLPIKHAEIKVTNASGQVVQCGKTDANGALRSLDGSTGLRIPNVNGDYTVSVLSRAVLSTPFPSNFSVKDDIYNNSPYAVSDIATVNNGSITSSPLDLNALAIDNNNLGGAFNIYNNIVTTYQYLQDNTGGSSLACLSAKLHVYWKSGFNPYAYLSGGNQTDTTLSFYIRGDSEIYINGGVQGNVATADTDHFDDAVIIHELGHHIESVCGNMDSPGGSHNGTSRIDPRLAWSEGWGNFFGAHIIKNNLSSINPGISGLPNGEWLFYFDSNGYGDSTGYEYVRINLARKGNASPQETIRVNASQSVTVNYDPVVPSSSPGESHFREISIARGLFKMTNSCTGVFSGNCANVDRFEEIWKSFDKNTGMGQSSYPFTSSARLFHVYRDQYALTSEQETILTNDEALQTYGDASFTSGGFLRWPAYGTKLAFQAGPCSPALRIEPLPNARTSSGGYTYKSDQRYSNHFFWYDPSSLPGITQVQLEKTNVSGNATVDIGLLLFNEGYVYNEDCKSTGCSKSLSGTGLVAAARSSPYVISTAGLNSGTKYLLNVRAFSPGPSTDITSEYNYNLKVSGGYLCPSSY